MSDMQDHPLEPTPKASPAELADHLERLPDEDAAAEFSRLSSAEGAAVLAELDPETAAQMLGSLDTGKAVSALQLLPANQIADLLLFFTEAAREEVLRGIPADISARVSALLAYAPDTAGGIMDNRFIAVRAEGSVSEALERLRSSPGQQSGDISYIYAVGRDNRLVGVVALRDLVFSAAEATIAGIMNREVSFLRVDDDQEEIARKMQHRSFLGFPVVDKNGRLVGVVRAQDAVRVAQTEATEDMQLMVGLSGEERIWTSWQHSIRKRLPWLGINVGTALGGAVVVSFFEGTTSKWTALVAFLPLISAVAGNGGNQALTVIVRSLALGEVAPGDAGRALRKELYVGAVNGLALALVIGLIAFAWKGSALLGVVAGSAMVLNQIIGALAGVAVPFGLKWFKIDPALASSIFVTAITDVMGFLVFLGSAALAMRMFGI
jgi:magnesium transporter